MSKPMEPELLAIIPFFRRAEQLEKCLVALKQSVHPVTPFVHDNNTINIGFTKACNLGLKSAIEKGSTYALLLNQDCYVFPETIGTLVKFMDEHPRCAISGPKQLWARDPDQIIHGGCSHAYPQGKNITGRKSAGDCTVSIQSPWINGAAMMIRLTALREIGLMDEAMILVGSDSDICYTARARGWECWYCAEAECLHEEGTSADTRDTGIYQVLVNDMNYWRDKWIGPNLYARLLTVGDFKSH